MNTERTSEAIAPVTASKKKMTEVTKLSAARYLSGVHRRALDARRRYEWQILVASLASGSTLTLGILSGKIHVPAPPEFRLLAVTYLFALAIVASLYLFSIQVANAANKKLAHAAENAIGRSTKYKPLIEIIDQIENRAQIGKPGIAGRTKAFWLRHWSITCELLAVWFAALASDLAIWFA